jgi:hypothetical protein
MRRPSGIFFLTIPITAAVASMLRFPTLCVAPLVLCSVGLSGVLLARRVTSSPAVVTLIASSIVVCSLVTVGMAIGALGALRPLWWNLVLATASVCVVALAPPKRRTSDRKIGLTVSQALWGALSVALVVTAIGVARHAGERQDTAPLALAFNQTSTGIGVTVSSGRQTDALLLELGSASRPALLAGPFTLRPGGSLVRALPPERMPGAKVVLVEAATGTTLRSLDIGP